MEHFESAGPSNEAATTPVPELNQIDLMKTSADRKRYKKPKIDDFEIKEMIGIGHFGRVHRAINKKENNRVCALKILEKASVGQMK